jgi:hypothetical protein
MELLHVVCVEDFSIQSDYENSIRIICECATWHASMLWINPRVRK